jgi:hypothetical protein
LFNLNTLLIWGKYIGYPLVILITLIGIRYLYYFHSYFFRWKRYRHLERVTDEDIRALPYVPFMKIQITTRGSLGSTEVIERGIENINHLIKEAPELYSPFISVEVVTESIEQKLILEKIFENALFSVQVFVLPKGYQTPKNTMLKARALHYMVELRRRGVNRKPGKTFIVHFDEESVMEPDELRKLFKYLATTDKKLTEGPIYYPLEYTDASAFCRAMEANRPIGCFECRQVMESGTPLHLHGSNLVIEEDLENELGWDIGNLDGQPFIAEDYVFGVLAYLHCGPQIFGWHGCVMLEQPPFSFKSAFKQRFRWIIGILQGMSLMKRMPEFYQLSHKMRFNLVWGTRYRIATFGFGLPTGAITLLYLLYQTGLVIYGKIYLPLPIPIMLWLIIIGFLWLNSIFIGSWYNISNARQLSTTQRWTEVGRVITLAPLAGILESTAGFWAMIKWALGKRHVYWQPTPKTKHADNVLNVMPNVANRKIFVRVGLASFVSLLAVGATLQIFTLSTHKPLLQIPSGQNNPIIYYANRDQYTGISVRMKRPDFQTGVIFPQWGSSGYDTTDQNWQTGLKDISNQTGAQWIEIPINFYQSSVTSTQVMVTDQTPSLEALTNGIRAAKDKDYHVFVVPLITVEGTLKWSGSIQFATFAQTQAWFASYWQVYQPYVVAAQAAGADQLAIGTEDELLQEAPASLWNNLIAEIHGAFHGKLTYDINWSSLYYPLPQWLQNPYLSVIGVSVYNPLTTSNERVDPAKIPGLWQDIIGTQLDALSTKLSKSVIVSEIGYRDSEYALYMPWRRDQVAQAEPADPQEQAAAYDAALRNAIVDKHISGIFFWAWSDPLFEPNWKPAATILYKWYTSPQA